MISVNFFENPKSLERVFSIIYFKPIKIEIITSFRWSNWKRLAFSSPTNPIYKEVVEKLSLELKEMRIKYKDSEELDKSFIY